MAKPVLVYDGDCGFCRFWVERWRAATGARVEYIAAREAAARFPQLSAADLAEAVHLVEPDGRASRGAEAVFRSLARAGGARRLGLALYENASPFRAASERAYRFVAARRPLFSRLTRLLWGSAPACPSVQGVSRVVIAGLGLCYLAAFASFGAQARGLVGRDGLLPAAQLLAAARQFGPQRFWLLPTFSWISTSDAVLVGQCAAGALAAFGLICGVAAGPCALACWALYLSLCSIGSDFMGFQWDVLLLEAGLLALFLAPWRGPARRAPASRGALFLLRLLLFKLVLQSGMVKWLGGDPSWLGLTALSYHYWTQPLPTPPAWWASQLPLGIQRLCCAAMFAVELGAPWLLLGPRRVRAVGAGAVALLMLSIGLTGNYGFFNLLTLVLCAAVLDDSFPLLARPAPAPFPRAAALRGRALALFAALWLVVSAVQWSLQCGLRPPLAAAWRPLLSAVAPLRSINSYGLFAVMTTTRDEVMIEVSVDGREWREWPFRWKPGEPRRAPGFVAPHMPRLDWQMWFAALGAPSPWFDNLLYRLLQGSPAVAALLGPSPLDARPAYARASLWATRFSTREERRVSGAWWARERKGLFFPVVSLASFPSL